MESYQQIKSRIIEIITISYSRKEKDKNSFTRILKFNISNDLKDEFASLIDLERSLYLYHNSENPLKSNTELLDSIQNETSKEHEELKSILEKSNKEQPENLIEHLGYFISKKDFLRFKELCKKLKIGINSPLKNTKNAEEIINENLKNNTNQYKRIVAYLEQYYQEQQESKKEETKQEEQTPKRETETRVSEGLQHIQNAKYKELIYLTKLGKINIDAFKDLQNIMSRQEYEELLEELKTHKIISVEQETKLKGTQITNINDINELLNFFITKKDIELEGLKGLISSIGKDNYDYLVDELFRHGALSITEYKKYLDDLINSPTLK